MTDDITLEDLGLPNVLYDPDDGTEWHLSDPVVDLEVRMTHPDTDGDTTDATVSSYPLDALLSKLEHGDLSFDPPEPDDADDGEDQHVCEECGEPFDSQQGLAGHQPCPDGDGDDGDDA